MSRISYQYITNVWEIRTFSKFIYHSCVFFTSIKYTLFFAFLAHLSRRLTRWAYSIPVEPASVRASVRPSVHASVRVFTLSNMNISETNGLIETKFYLKHHWVGGKAAFSFGSDRIGTLVSMATESSHRVVMEKTVSPLFLACFFILAGNDDMHESSDEFEFRPAQTTDCGVSCPWTSEKIPIGL